MTTGRINQVAFLTDIEVRGHEGRRTIERRSNVFHFVRQIEVTKTPCQPYFPNPSVRAEKRGPRRQGLGLVRRGSQISLSGSPATTNEARVALGDRSMNYGPIPSSRYETQETRVSAKAR